MNKELKNCPYCGHKAVVLKSKEMSDTSVIHTITCGWLNCLSIEKALSGWSPDYNKSLERMTDEWHVIVTAILKDRAQ